MTDRNMFDRVVQCIASTTRYPVQVLTKDADLADDLGIDSVKRVEIVASLEREFELDLSSQQRDPAIRTIGHVAEWLQRMVTETASGASEVAPQPVLSAAGAADIPSNDAVRSATATTVVPMWRQSDRLSEHVAGDSGDSGGGQLRISPSHRAPPPPVGEPARPRSQSAAPGRLDGRVALVTGSGRGVGRTIARVLASRGATVIINSFHSRDQGEQVAEEIRATGATALHLWGSVANPGHVEEIFNQITGRLGRLDILVCNASDGRIGPFTEVSPEDWERAFRTNVTGHHHCAMLAKGLMQPVGGGSIVTMSSIAARRYVEGLGGQGVIKAAVESMTRYLACELAPCGIRANCVSGGPVYGEVMARYPAARETLGYWETLVTDGELCSPLDLANTVAYLVSDEARGVNGAIWDVDHGLSTRSHSRPLPRPMLAGESTKLAGESTKAAFA